MRKLEGNYKNSIETYYKMTIAEKKWVLSLPKEVKLDLLEKMLVENKFGEAFQLQKILLEAPISEGGIVTEELNKVFTNYVNII